MQEKDAITKKYLGDNEIFADLFNGFFFNGEKRIQELRPLDTAHATMLFSDSDNPDTVQRYRDLLKFAVVKTDEKVAYALLGVENQSRVDPTMISRAMLYDALQYDLQHKKAKDKHKLIPVVTLVLYFGEAKWEYPTRLLDYFADSALEILKYVSDYRMNLFAVNAMTDQDLEKFSTELGRVFRVIRSSSKKEDILAYANDPAYSNLSEDGLRMINTYIGRDIPFVSANEEGKCNMCEGIRQMEEAARAEGRIEEQVNAVRAIMESMSLSIEQAMECLKIPADEKENIRSLVEQER